MPSATARRPCVPSASSSLASSAGEVASPAKPAWPACELRITVGTPQASWPSRCSANRAAALPTWPVTTSDWIERMFLGELKRTLHEFGEGAGAMTEAHLPRRPAVLVRARHLAEGDVEAIGHEHRIEAKTLVAARRPHHRARDPADIEVVAAIGRGEAEGGVERALAQARRIGADRLQAVLDAAHRHLVVAAVGRRGPVGGIDAGLATERIDTQAGIVGKRDHVGGRSRGVRLEPGILDERRSSLFRFGQVEVL